MNKEIIIKLLGSSIEDDVLLAMEYLLGKSQKDLLKYFDTSLYKTIVPAKLSRYASYKLSNDGVITIIANVFISNIKDSINITNDLTK